MISLLCSLGRKSLPLLAVLIACLLPEASQAQGITIKNTTGGPVVITTTYTVPGLKIGRPITLKAGDTTPAITPLATKVRIVILDPAQPNGKPLGGGDFVVGNNNLDLVIVPSTDPKWKVMIQPAPP